MPILGSLKCLFRTEEALQTEPEVKNCSAESGHPGTLTQGESPPNEITAVKLNAEV